MNPRAALDHAIRSAGESYAAVSRLIGRNPTYIQQFIRRGVPRRLEEGDCHRLASHLGIDPAAIGAMLPASTGSDAGTSHDAGADLDGAYCRLATLRRDFPAPLAFRRDWLDGFGPESAESLASLAVEGDAMLPALAPGDQLLVDRRDGGDRLRDGLYALRLDGALLVKRLAINPATRMVTILSDNAAYPSWEALDPALLDIVGRVVWTGRRFL